MIGGVYFAYPIDQVQASLAHMYQQIEAFKAMLINSGLVKWVFDPGDAFTVNGAAQPDDTIGRINRAAAHNADLIAAFLPQGVPTIGVPMEIDRAVRQGKHVLVFSDIDQSWMLQLPRVWRATAYNDEAFAHALEYISRLSPPEESKLYYDLLVTGEREHMPTRAYPDDAGLDLYVSEDVTIPLGEFRDVPCGISVSLPEHTWGLVTGRSSALRKRGLLVHSGIIDAGYRGPLFAGAFALQHEVALKRGERIAQLIVINNTTQYVTPIEVEQLPDSARGTNGFGSSGD